MSVRILLPRLVIVGDTLWRIGLSYAGNGLVCETILSRRSVGTQFEFSTRCVDEASDSFHWSISFHHPHTGHGDGPFSGLRVGLKSGLLSSTYHVDDSTCEVSNARTTRSNTSIQRRSTRSRQRCRTSIAGRKGCTNEASIRLATGGNLRRIQSLSHRATSPRKTGLGTARPPAVVRAARRSPARSPSSGTPYRSGSTPSPSRPRRASRCCCAG